GAGTLLALVFRDPADEAGLQLLRDYRDLTLALGKHGVSICAIAQAEPSALAYLRHERGLGFPLFADPDGTALPRWGMLGATGLLLLDRDLIVLQRALGNRAPAEALLSFVRRRGTHAHRGLRNRFAHFLHLLSHAITPRRLAR
ncbi:MAG: peroxiredoxin family protein, partial [Myxococcales bacterium]